MRKIFKIFSFLVLCLFIFCGCINSNSGINSTLTDADVENLLNVYHKGGILKNNCTADNLNEEFLITFYSNINPEKYVNYNENQVQLSELEECLSEYFDISSMDFSKSNCYDKNGDTISLSPPYAIPTSCEFDRYVVSGDNLEIYYSLNFLIRGDGRKVHKKIILSKNNRKNQYIFESVSTYNTEDGKNNNNSIKEISDEELVNLTLDVAQNHNYTLWLFTPDLRYYVDCEIITIEQNNTYNGKTYTTQCNYAPVWEFDNIQDFTDCAKKYLSAEYVENYLLPLLDGPDCLLDVPMLKDINGKLYIQTSPNGTSIVPCFDYIKGEIIERGDTTAIVRLYTDPDKYDPDSYYPEYYDYTMIYENNGWRYNPHL